MAPESIAPTDYHRILLGRVPWTFAIEVVIRIGVVYVLLLVAMRLMGKRMSSQATRNELAALVSLAAAVGPAIQDPKNGFLPPVIVAAVVVATQRLAAEGTIKSARFEWLMQGSPSLLRQEQCKDEDQRVCVRCGHVEPKKNASRRCRRCHGSAWEVPVMPSERSVRKTGT
ncbi:hypothetical protein LZC95_04890 [Pendulispora brunnea]|uniref:DUF421 domain-containing protein n=1 Tax=Pendulispora brunnea TaxID=2905690 RepID=A0ABZ2KFR2_9BACT